MLFLFRWHCTKTGYGTSLHSNASYDFRGIDKILKCQGHHGKVSSQPGSHYNTAYLQLPIRYPCVGSTYNTLQFQRYSQDLFKFRITVIRSEVKPKSHHDIAHLHPNQYPCQILISYSCFLLTVSRFKMLKVSIRVTTSKVKGQVKVIT